MSENGRGTGIVGQPRAQQQDVRARPLKMFVAAALKHMAKTAAHRSILLIECLIDDQNAKPKLERQARQSTVGATYY